MLSVLQQNYLWAFTILTSLYTTAISTQLVQEPEEAPCNAPPAIQFGYIKHSNFNHKENLLKTNGNTSTGIEETNLIPKDSGSLVVFSKHRVAYPSGSIVEYGCDDGYRLKPPNYKNICNNGVWQSGIPNCVARGCSMPPSIMNGYFLELSEMRNGLFESGATLELLCHTGYLIRGPDIYTCEESGIWTPERNVKCVPSPKIKNKKMCNIPPDVWGASKKLLRGLVNKEGALHLTVIEYRCQPGYRNVLSPCDPHTLTCRQGEWFGTSPQCERFTSCIAPPNIANGYLYEVASTYPIHSQVYYACDHGFRLIGPSVLTCKDTGCWVPSRPPVCQLTKPIPGQGKSDEKSKLDVHSLVIAAASGIFAVILLSAALLVYHRTLGPKLLRLRNSNSGNELQPPESAFSPPGITADYDPDRVALIPFPTDPRAQSVPPSYEEAIRQRPILTVDHQASRYTPHTHRSRGHRVVVTGVRRSRHRDNPDNLSYQSIGSARQSSGTSRSMSMRSWSACDSLGSTDTMAISDSTNVTVETLSSGAYSGASQTPSCRGLAGSRASFDTSSLINNEGAPLLEETETDETRPVDTFSFSTRDSDSLKDNVSHTRSVTISLQEPQ